MVGGTMAKGEARPVQGVVKRATKEIPREKGLKSLAAPTGKRKATLEEIIPLEDDGFKDF
jgi:hypothetical protein